MQQPINWDPIRQEYIQDQSTSYRRLASKYGVSLSQIANVARAEDWVTARKQHRNAIGTAVEEAAVAEAVDAGLAAVREIGEIARRSMERIEERIQDAGNGTQMEAAMGALRTALGVIRDAYGLETAGEKAKRLLDERKLALEEKKASRGEENAGGGLVIRIDSGEDFAG